MCFLNRPAVCPEAWVCSRRVRWCEPGRQLHRGSLHASWGKRLGQHHWLRKRKSGMKTIPHAANFSFEHHTLVCRLCTDLKWTSEDFEVDQRGLWQLGDNKGFNEVLTVSQGYTHLIFWHKLRPLSWYLDETCFVVAVRQNCCFWRHNE